MRQLFFSSPFFNPIFALIKFLSSISQEFALHICYFHNGLSSSQIMVFISFWNLQLYPSSSTKFRVHKLSFHNFFQNTTIALGARMRPYSYMYCTLSRDRALQILPLLEHFFIEMNKLNSKERKIPHSKK